MNAIFYLIINNVSVTSVILISILIFRIVFKNIPKRIYPMLWGVAGLKLLFPFDIYTSFGVLSSEKTIETATSGNAPIIIRTGVKTLDQGVNHYIGTISKGHVASANNTMQLSDVLTIIWGIGVLCMLGYLLISYLLMKRKVSQSMLVEDGVSICDEISSPFLLGIIKPHIYMPSGLEKSKHEYVLAHERMHIKRRDSLWKILAFGLLSVYWFNPLCWIAYILFCKDVELACDESVIKRYDPSWRADYCQTLLECSNGSRKSIFIPVAFGEVGVKERVKRVLCYKKSKPMVICAALILCGGILLCVGTKHNANTPSGNQEKSVATSSKGKNNLPDNEFYGKTPTIDLSASPGVDGAMIYYADEEKIIFGGYFGLFVYDTKNHTYIQSVDLESIGYSMTQGDAACEIQANKDGSLVYLQKMNDKEHMLIYHVDDNRFEQVTSDYKKDFLFDGFRVDEDYVSTTEVTFRDYTGTGNECWLVNGGDGSTLGSLGYKYLNDQLVYPLFTQERFKGAEYFKSKDIKNIVKAEMNFQGKHYVCTEEKILEKLEKGFSKGKKLDGRSGCPFDDVMYLTREDGVVGMVLPATDSCKACYLSDGYYDLNDSLAISVRELIEKGKFYVDESVDPEDKNEQEKIILSTVESSMPDIIYQEIIQKGICKKIYNDRDETTTFRLENDSENPTLCLDFSFDKEGNLIQYVNKEYGFTEDMNKKEVAAGEGAHEKVSAFANSLEKQEFNEERGLKKVKSPTRWEDKRYECYQDKKGILYVWDQEYGMVVFAEYRV